MTDDFDYQRHSFDYYCRKAIPWLRARGGDGAVTRSGRVLALGDLSPVSKRIWLELEKRGQVEFYAGASGRSRLRLKEEQ
jgi:hypothetical protein